MGTTINPIVFWTLFAGFIAALFLACWSGAKLSKNLAIRRFLNTGLGMFTGVGLAFVGFLAAIAGAIAEPTRISYIAWGIVFYSFFISAGIYSEEPRGTRRTS